MLILKRNILAAALLSALAYAGGATARAQETPQGNTVVGPPQLRDFRLPGERRTPPAQPQADEPIIQPPRQQTPSPSPRITPAQPPSTAQPDQRTPQAQTRPAPAPGQPRARPAPSSGPAMTPAPAPQPPAPSDSAPPADRFAPAAPGLGTDPASAPLPLPGLPAPSEAPQPGGGYSMWIYLVPIALALLGTVAWRRRRAFAAPGFEHTDLEPVAQPAAAPVRPEPKPRPWIELEFKPERAAATLTEANVQFELVVRNSGGSAARNIRIEARMFNAGREQDKEIGAFFRRPASEVSKTSLPTLDAQSHTSFRSIVTMPRESVRAVNVQGRTLFVPMVAFNVFYEWGEARRGQTSRSYVVGRELEQPAERMAPFRLDLGPRIYRTVGQREHSLARRV